MLVRSVNLSDTSKKNGVYVNPGPGHFVQGFVEDPIGYLEREFQDQLDAGKGMIWIANPFGRDTGRDVYKDVPIAPQDYHHAPTNVVLGLKRFLESPGIEEAFLYVGGPDTTYIESAKPFETMMWAINYVETLKQNLPNATMIWDGVGDVSGSVFSRMNAVMAAADVMNRRPVTALGQGSVGFKWGFEPNPATRLGWTQIHRLMSPRYVCGSVRNWQATTRASMAEVKSAGCTPVVMIRGDEFPDVNDRILEGKKWEESHPSAIIVVYGLTCEQYLGMLG